jgi:hypothetical protein
MPQRDPEEYTQGDDGLIAEKVGSWAKEKLKLVTDYVYASGGARKKYLNTGAAYIDPFCGPGRSLVRSTTTFIDGSGRCVQTGAPIAGTIHVNQHC